MALPRIFVSSTYYDLKHMRSSLEKFIESLGFEAILSEKGSIAYSPDRPLDESCYKEAESADIFVLIMGGRYGSASSSENKDLQRSFFDRYDSITKKEFEAAVSADIPIYIAIDRPVYVEYETFLKNRESQSTQYVQVQNVNVFLLLESILNMPRNNPVFPFDRPAEVEDWLRLQWAGLFGEMLRTRTQQAQLTSLAGQVANLSEVNKTLKVYLEEVVSKVSKEKAAEIISSEDSRLRTAREQIAFRKNPFVQYVERSFGIPSDRIAKLLEEHRDVKVFLEALGKEQKARGDEKIARWQKELPLMVNQDIELRGSLGLPYDESLAAERLKDPRFVQSIDEPWIEPKSAMRKTSRKAARVVKLEKRQKNQITRKTKSKNQP